MNKIDKMQGKVVDNAQIIFLDHPNDNGIDTLVVNTNDLRVTKIAVKNADYKYSCFKKVDREFKFIKEVIKLGDAVDFVNGENN